MRKSIYGLVGSFVFCATLGAGDPENGNWSRFRGPNGTGISSDKNIPIQWSDQDGILWKTPIPGAGYSSPIVWGNYVFLQSASTNGDDRLLLCLNAADGKVVWSRSAPGSAAHIHPKNSLASSTPATDGERVYALFWDGEEIALFAYNFKGDPLWKQGLGPFKSQHGVGISPMVHGDKVYLANDQDGSAVLIALQARTGNIVWKTPRPAYRACYSTPFILDKELIVASTFGVSGYNPQTGVENWHWTWTHDGMPLRTVASPITSEGLIFINSGDGRGDRHTVAVKIGEKGADTKTNLVWENKKSFPYVTTLLAWGEHVYYVNDRGIAGCHVAKTGEAVWNERLCAGMTASPILIDGKIYAVDDKGDAYVFSAATKFDLLAKSSIGEPVTATPAVAAGRLFVRGAIHLYCIGKARAK